MAATTNVTVQNMQEGIEKPRGTAAWYARRRRDSTRDTRDRRGRRPTTSRRSCRRSTLPGVARPTSPDRTTIKSVSSTSSGWFETRQDAKADLQQDYRTGVPDSVVVRNTPFADRDDQMNRDLGVLRAGHLDLQAPDGQRRHPARETECARTAAGTSPGRPLRSARSFRRDRRTCRTGSDVAPRFGVGYDCSAPERRR